MGGLKGSGHGCVSEECEGALVVYAWPGGLEYSCMLLCPVLCPPQLTCHSAPPPHTVEPSAELLEDPLIDREEMLRMIGMYSHPQVGGSVRWCTALGGRGKRSHPPKGRGMIVDEGGALTCLKGTGPTRGVSVRKPRPA